MPTARGSQSGAAAYRLFGDVARVFLPIVSETRCTAFARAPRVGAPTSAWHSWGYAQDSRGTPIMASPTAWTWPRILLSPEFDRMELRTEKGSDRQQEAAKIKTCP